MEDRTREGEAYAVLTDAGELIFFRSEEKYEDGKVAHARDVLGHECEGHVFAGVETEQWSFDVRPGWHGKRIKSARIADGQAIAPVSCAWWFAYCDGLTDCDLDGMDTSNVTNMDNMFMSCHNLKEPPDTSKWDMSNVTDMKFMFYDCESLVAPPDTSGWDTSRVTNMKYMFHSCYSLTTPPDTSHWDTSKVEDMSYMFNSCAALSVPPDMSGWDTTNVVNSDYMFYYCDSLETEPELPLPNRDGETR